ncbi:hypothetical protein [Nocardioides sp. GXQ0305]|uniref:hypothetical protein n=1 Tax=Nocardioides sp. GXQ0305 TaxID=3423912 RepID=UPI003D7C4D26
MERDPELVPHSEPFTLLAPYGGPASRLDHVETHAWGDTLVVAMVERQHGRVEGRPDQDLSLRITHVHRRVGEEWQLVHRHADPLVDTMALEDLQGLMRR